MKKLPEVIYAGQPFIGPRYWAGEQESPVSGTKYIRADKVSELEARIQSLELAIGRAIRDGWEISPTLRELITKEKENE